MSDVFTKAKRSDVMSRIRSRGNKDTELALAKVFRRHGITGWRRHQPVFGKPDFIFKQLRLALFVDGCFWHGCPKHAAQPKNNRRFWQEKFSKNKRRDALVTRILRRAGWRVLRIWGHELIRKKEAQLLGRVQRALNGRSRIKPHPVLSRIKIKYDPIEPASEAEWPKRCRRYRSATAVQNGHACG